MKCWKMFLKWLRYICSEVFGMTLEVDEKTGKIDASKVKNVCRHFDGTNYYYTAEVNGVLIFLVYTNDLKNWFENSGIDVCDFSGIWESPIPDNRKLVECDGVPKVTTKSKLGK